MTRNKKSWPVLIVLSPSLIVPLPDKRFPNKLVPNVLKNIVFFINKPDSSNKLTILLIWFSSSFEIINVVPDAKRFLWIATFVVDAAAVNPNSIKTLLSNGLTTFPIKGKPAFSNGLKVLPKNPPDCPILCKWNFDNLILAEEPFAKA